MRKKSPVFFMLTLFVCAPLSGCFGNSDSSASEENSDVGQTLSDWHVYSVSSTRDLPVCSAETQGRLYYLMMESSFSVCTTTGWTDIDVRGETGQDGTDGADGNDGPPGIDGEDGQDGADGLPGSNGYNVVLDLVEEPIGENCKAGGNKILVGLDLNRNTILDIGEVQNQDYICNPSSTGQLLNSISSPPARCQAGGYIDSKGMDNGDGGGISGNTILENGEIDVQTTVCSEYIMGPLIDEIGSIDIIAASSSYVFYELYTSRGEASIMSYNIITEMRQVLATGGNTACWSDDYECGVIVNGNLYFTTRDDNTHRFYSSDGTESGTTMISQLQNRVIKMVTDNTNIYLALYDSGVWKYDGNSVVQISTENVIPGQDSNAYPFKTIGSTLFFVASGSSGYNEIWISDGTASGTTSTGCDLRISDGSPYDQILFYSNNWYMHCYKNDGSTNFAIHKYNPVTDSLTQVADTTRLKIMAEHPNGILLYGRSDCISILDSSDSKTQLCDIWPRGSMDSRYTFTHDGELYYAATASSFSNPSYLYKMNRTTNTAQEIIQLPYLGDLTNDFHVVGDNLYMIQRSNSVWLVTSLNLSSLEYETLGPAKGGYYGDFLSTSNTGFFLESWGGLGGLSDTIHWTKHVHTTTVVN